MLSQALASAELPDGRGWRAWVACESNAVRSIRGELLARDGVQADQLHTRGYWKAGVANHPDHDMGLD